MTVLLAGCSTGPGPLGDGGTAGQQCMQYPPRKPVTTGIYDLTNAGGSPVTILSVTLPSAHSLRMTKAWLVPITKTANGGTLDFGAGWPYPPSFTKVVQSVWAQRRPAVGGTIKPGQDLNLVFGLIRATASAATSDGPAITYTAGGSSYTVNEKTSLEVAAGC